MTGILDPIRGMLWAKGAPPQGTPEFEAWVEAQVDCRVGPDAGWVRRMTEANHVFADYRAWMEFDELLWAPEEDPKEIAK